MTDSAAGGGRRGQLASSGLRPGWTTGACAAAAARAAYTALLDGDFPDPVTVLLPLGRTPRFALTDHQVEGDEAMAAVTKDAGDDPDVTHGAVIRAWVRPNPPGRGVTFAAGPGVGTVTLPGLPLAVGEPAINPVPRRIIRDNLRAALAEHLPSGPAPAPEPGPATGSSADPDLHVRIGIDDGEEIARHTWNSRVGVMGGLSVLGTTGVVVPYSCSAWIDSIRRGIDVARAAGIDHVAACTGSTSEQVAGGLGLVGPAVLDMGDFAGAVLKYLRGHPVPRLTLCGGFAKLTKLADGHLDLHSHRTRVDLDRLAGRCRDAGGGAPLVEQVRTSTTAMGALGLAHAAGIPLGDAVAAAARDEALRVLRGAPVAVDVVCIDRAGGIVGRCAPAGPS